MGLDDDVLDGGTVFCVKPMTAILSQDGTVYWVNPNERRDMAGFREGQVISFYRKIKGNQKVIGTVVSVDTSEFVGTTS